MQERGLKRDYVHRTIQELLGHSDVKTAMVDTHVLNRGGKGVIVQQTEFKHLEQCDKSGYTARFAI